MNYSSNKTIEQIPHIYPSLRQLIIDSTSLRINKLLYELAEKCHHLTNLKITLTDSKNAGQLLACIQNIHKLEVLSISFTDSFTDSFDPLCLFEKNFANFKKLHTLDLTGFQNVFSTLPQTILYINIIFLSVSPGVTTDELSHITAALINLVFLSLYNHSLSTDCFNHLISLNQLKSLNIASPTSGSFCFDVNVEYFLLKRGKQLESLDFSDMEHLDLNIIASNCPNLRCLYLGGYCGEILFDWTNKQILNEETRGESFLETCTQLTHFILTCNQISHEDSYKIFRGCNNLTHLKLKVDHNATEEGFFSKFFTCFQFDSLKELDLSCNKLTVDIIYSIFEKSCPQITKLNVTGCCLIEIELKKIESIIKQSNSVIELQKNGSLSNSFSHFDNSFSLDFFRAYR